MLHIPPLFIFNFLFLIFFLQGPFARLDLVSVECQKVNDSTLDLFSS